MLARNFFLFFFLSYCRAKRSLVPQAILQVVKDYYGESSVKIEVFYNSEGLKVLEETLKLLSRVKELKVTKVNSATDIDWERLTYYNDAVFLFDTVENYLILESAIMTKSIKNERSFLSFLVYCEDSTRLKAQSMNSSVLLQSFLLEENDEISLNTLTFYTEKQCGVTQLVEINRFSAPERKWSTKKYFVLKIENFHGCELIFHFNANASPILNYELSEDGKSFIFEGVLNDIIRALSANLNFTTLFVPIDGWDPTYWYLMVAMVYENFMQNDLTSSDLDKVLATNMPWENILLQFFKATGTWLISLGVLLLVIVAIKIFNSPSMSAIFMKITRMVKRVCQFLSQRNLYRISFAFSLLSCSLVIKLYHESLPEFTSGDLEPQSVASIKNSKDTFYGDFDIFINPTYFNMFKG